MEFFKSQSNINFLAVSRITGIVSISLVILSLILLSTKGLNFGMEFTGGIEASIKAPENLDLKSITNILQQQEVKVFKLAYTDNQNIIMQFALPNDKMDVEQNLTKYLTDIFNDIKIEITQIDFVGSEVGERLREQGMLAALVAILATMIYIAIRFEYRLAISSALSLVHDAILILGIFALFQIEFDLATLASVLAVIGYSLNDTIVIFDRIRENFKLIRKANVVDIINISINQTLSRTIMTSVLTLLVVLALLFFGGDTLFGFSIALTVGIVIGTYSSIYVAGIIAVTLGLSREDMLPTKKAIDSLP